MLNNSTDRKETKSNEEKSRILVGDDRFVFGSFHKGTLETDAILDASLSHWSLYAVARLSLKLISRRLFREDLVL